MRHPYDTSVREPLWPWTAKLFVWALGGSPVALRYFSFAFSVLLLFVAYRFVRDYTRSVEVALLATLVLARHTYLIASSSEGHRTELFGVALLLLVYHVFVRDLSRRRRLVGLTVGSAACVLTSLSSVVTVVPLLAWSAWCHRVTWRGLVVPLGCAATLIAPHLVSSYQHFGDPFWFSDKQVAVFYRNYEFVVVKKTGCDGCPSPSEVSASWFTGRIIGLREYVFGMHSAGEVASRVLRGYYDLYVGPDALHTAWLGSTDPVTPLLYYGGLVSLLVGPYRELLLWPLLAINLLAFLIPLQIDPRLVMHTAPIGAMAVALSLRHLGVWAAAIGAMIAARRRDRERGR